MRKLVKNRLAAIRQTDGLTLVEVIVAILILGILTTASLGFYFTGVNSSASLQRRDVAVALANNGLEQVSSWSTSIDAAGISAIYNNRSAAAVSALWTAGTAASVPGVAQTYPIWDPTPSSSTAVGDLPTTVSGSGTTVNGTVYTIQTYLGQCFEPLAGGSCTKLPGLLGLVAPTLASQWAGYTPLVRVIVNVTWTAGCSSSSPCSYQTTSLLDTKSDLVWRANG